MLPCVLSRCRAITEIVAGDIMLFLCTLQGPLDTLTDTSLNECRWGEVFLAGRTDPGTPK